jgi:phosphoribosylpyrophosphate synthetase
VAHNGLDFGIKSVNDIDLILSVPSSRLANDKILEILHSTIPNAAAFRHAFAKGLTENVKVDHDRILSESSKKTPAYVENEVRCMKEKHKGQRFEVKFLEMSFRRYVYNFMTVILENAANLIRGKNVLLVDDTIGEGITLKETSRLVNQFQPKSIIGFAITRDMYRT